MAMISDHELSKIKKRIWLFVISDRKTPTDHEKHLIEQLESFALKHQNTSWAMNARCGRTDGTASARVAIVMKNPCSMLALKKGFKNPECRLDLNAKAIWPFLSCDGNFEKEKIISSDNWKWDGIGLEYEFKHVFSKNQPAINITVNNLYIITDEESKKILLEAFRK